MRDLDSGRQAWEEFVRRCAAAFDAGISDREFAQNLVGQRVTWTGKIERFDMEKNTIVPGIAMTMPWIEIPLKNGRSFVGSYLFLRLKADDLNRARKREMGDAVTFSGKFADRGVFPSVNFDVDDEQRKVFISMTLEEGELLE